MGREVGQIVSIVLIIERLNQPTQSAAEILKAELDGDFFLHAFDDGAEALRFLSRVQPDAVLLDLDLSAGLVTGSEVLAKIAAIMGLGRVVVVSDIESAELSRWLAGMGVGRFVLKPYVGRLLAKEIRRVAG